jgi:hypothetical protein
MENTKMERIKTNKDLSDALNAMGVEHFLPLSQSKITITTSDMVTILNLTKPKKCAWKWEKSHAGHWHNLYTQCGKLQATVLLSDGEAFCKYCGGEIELPKTDSPDLSCTWKRVKGVVYRGCSGKLAQNYTGEKYCPDCSKTINLEE